MSVGDVNTRAEFDAVSTEKNYECVERFGDMFLFWTSAKNIILRRRTA